MGKAFLGTQQQYEEYSGRQSTVDLPSPIVEPIFLEKPAEIVFVDRPVIQLIEKLVYVDVIKEVEKIVIQEKIIDRPVEVIKEVIQEKLVEKPVYIDIIKEVEKIVFQEKLIIKNVLSPWVIPVLVIQGVMILGLLFGRIYA